MRSVFLLTALFCTGCLLHEYRSTETKQHIFSQEDTSFYFSDCIIKSRADSFDLARLGKEMKFFNGQNLSNSKIDEIRLSYDRTFHQRYLISLQRSGKIVISTIDTAHGEQYETAWDTLHLSAMERKLRWLTWRHRYYTREKKPDSASYIKVQNPGLVDSLYDRHLYLTMWAPVKDSVAIVTTTLYDQTNLFNKIVSQLETIHFWDMPVYEDWHTTDGSSWTLEAKVGDRHHVACQVNNITEDRRFEYVCKMLVKYANIPREDIY
jgi:hypothetical protein